MTQVNIIPFNATYPISRTSAFTDGIAAIKLGTTLLHVKREGTNYILLAKSSHGSIPVITEVTMDERDRLICVCIGNSGPLAELGCTMIAEGFTP